MQKPSSDDPLMTALALHYDDLIAHIRLRFKGRHFARDLVHDVCVQVLEKPPGEPVAQPLAFLRKMIFNRAIDRVRAERIRQTHADLPMPEESGIDSWDGAQALDFEQQLKALLAIIEALPARQRQIFLLHRIHDMHQRDIAQALEISVNMVTQHFRKAITAIAQRWEPARRVCGQAESSAP
jgi:RNA polymerase sigma-70 factor (ECF subfamily)